MKNTTKNRNIWNKTVMTLLIIYLFLPAVSTFLYSISTKWSRSILPEGLTLMRYVEIFENTRFLNAVGRSLTVSSITILISLLIMIPTIFVIVVYFPKLEKYMQILALMPFAFPPVVVAVGLISLYSSGPIVLTGTMWILIGAYFVLIIPFMYQGIRNSLRTISAIDLMEAAELLGASKLKAFTLIIIPNIAPGIIVATLLSFAILFGEFVYVNMMVGGQFETIQIYVYQMMRTDGHMVSVMVTLLFIFIFIISAIVFKLGSGKSNTSIPIDDEEETV